MAFVRAVMLGVLLLLVGAGVLGAADGLRFTTETSSASSESSTPPEGALSTPTPATPARIAGVTSASSSPVARVAASPAAASENASVSEIVAVASLSDQKLTVVDPLVSKVTGSFDLGIPPKSMALAPDGHSAWIFSAKPGASDFQIADLWKPERKQAKRMHDNPSAAAFSTDGRRAYVALGGGNDSPPAPSTIVFLNTTNNEEFGHVDVGVQTPGVQILRRVEAVAVAPGLVGDVVYGAGQLSGTVFALDGGSGKLLQQIEVGGGPIAVLADAAHQRVYVLVDTINELVAIDATTQSIVGRLKLPGRPTAASIAPDGTIYVTGSDAGEVWPVNSEMSQVGGPILVGSQPSAVGVSLDGHHVYVTSRGDSSLEVIDPARKQVTSRMPVGKDPVAILVGRDRPQAGNSATPTTLPSAQPTATPTIVPSPTPLPQGALPPEHVPSGVANETFLADAAYPVTFAFAPDGTLFYNELHTGNIRVVKNGSRLPEPFYNFNVSGEPEAGLIGLTLDPDFAQNHYIYVFYTSVPDGQPNGGPNGPNQVVRLTDVDDKGTDLRPILKDLPSGPIHNSGTIKFGPDGKLYVSLGDNDQGSNAQDLGTLAGKILRVNQDGSIPTDNPFVGHDGKQGAIWAYGFRNAFSFDFDPVSHGMLATHNGPGDNDELDLIVKGGNYGWPPTGYKYQPGIVDPIAVMNPPIGPTGMTFYTSDQVPDWKNDWFYCNYHQGQLRRVRLAPESRDRVVFEEVVKNGCNLNVAMGPDGALYYSNAKGIYRLHSADATNLLPVVTTATAEQSSPPAQDAATTPAPTPAATEQSLPAGTRPEDRDINVSLTEWKLQPSRTKVPAGQIRFLAENTGVTPHALRIVGQGIDVSTDSFGPGDSRSLTIVLPPGKYQLTCPVPGHEQQGMTATLKVVGS